MTRNARAERESLCDTLLATGPDAQTLCEGWTARDLAAHLVVRERRPDAQLGQLVPALSAHAASVQDAVRDDAWPDLVRTVRSGPPAWNIARLPMADEAMNTAEFFVHHEDVLRAQPGWSPRPLPDELQQALWRSLRVVGRLTLRRAPVGVELVAPGHGRLVARRGHPQVRVEGSPAELLLFAFGRRGVAQVHLDGPNAAMDELRGSRSGL